MRMPVLSIAAVLLIAPELSAQVTGITIDPPLPRSSDLVSIRIAGTLPTICYSAPSVQTSLSGNTIGITLNSASSGGPCILILGSFSKTVVVGPLEPGAYTVSAALFEDGKAAGPAATASFSVTAVVAPPIPAASLPALIGLAIGLSTIRYKLTRRRRE